MPQETQKPIIVQKYGGSSVSSIESIQTVAKRIVESTHAGFSVVVVVSAMGNKTNELLSLAHQISSKPPRRELDLLVSVGERISMTLLAMAIEELGVQARSFTGSQSGIITDTEHVAARIIEVRPYRIERALNEGFVAIVAGFQGMSIQKEVTTLGRGGSDTTAVALTAALGAEYCEICSDVDGIYSADPNLISGTQKISEINIDDALLLSGAGAKVLQHQALLYAKEKGISLVANATRLPIGKGTLIHHKKENASPTSIVVDKKLLLLVHSHIKDFKYKRHTRMMFQKEHQIYQVLDRRNLHGEELSSAINVVIITVTGSDSTKIIDQNNHLLQTEDILFWKYQENALYICLQPENAVELGQHLHAICFN
jgi:aspartate kinase